MPDFSDMLILQRVIPHYRVPLFAELYNRYGLRVVTSRTPPMGSFLNLIDPQECSFAIPADITFPNPAQPFRANVPINAILSNLNPKAVIAEFALRMTSTYQLAAARRLGNLPKLAYWTHGWQIDKRPSKLENLLVNALRPPLLSTADAIGTYTQSGQQWVSRNLPKTWSIALGNAIDNTHILAAKSRASAHRRGFPQLLSVGRITADKSFDLIIEAFALVRMRHPNAALTLIGDGPERERLRQLIASRQDPSFGQAVLLTGALHDEDDLAPHFMGADLLVLGGAAGLSVNHALAYRLPIVAFAESEKGPNHHPEIEYVIPSVSGVLVSPFTISALADSICEIVESSEHLVLRESLANINPAPSIQTVADRFGELCERLR
ncbi:glycosyltransferase [Brevundimonas sp. TWP2-3-4b1]|uniref:glycosyltransferase n=1 Tax=Brevundimonas sp. TWP2-3-4b1 TaxID=2804580 RepID=UPI003CEC73BC